MKVDHSHPKTLQDKFHQDILNMFYKSMEDHQMNEKYRGFFKIERINYNNINEYFPGKVFI